MTHSPFIYSSFSFVPREVYTPFCFVYASWTPIWIAFFGLIFHVFYFCRCALCVFCHSPLPMFCFVFVQCLSQLSCFSSLIKYFLHLHPSSALFVTVLLYKMLNLPHEMEHVTELRFSSHAKNWALIRPFQNTNLSFFFQAGLFWLVVLLEPTVMGKTIPPILCFINFHLKTTHCCWGLPLKRLDYCGWYLYKTMKMALDL